MAPICTPPKFEFGFAAISLEAPAAASAIFPISRLVSNMLSPE
jgi:hypothetical protein